MNLTGTWRGDYSYEQSDDLPKLPSRPIPFEMTLKQRWFGLVTGSIKDDARNGFAEPGKIRGSFKAPAFRFGKHFPRLRIVHEGQNQTLVDWAERWKFVLDDPDEPHPTIHCVGTLSDDGQTLTGTWRIAETKITIPGASGPLRLPELSGTWSAARA